ncbi:MAG: hypothetical protein Q7S40_10485 [Opitutaceae bacterium]|nr:hypothetical protein [Opitutaceae bacterium]
MNISLRYPRARFNVLMLAMSLASAVAAFAAEPAFSGPVECGRMAAPPKQETSGLAASRRAAGLLWTHDDSGGQPVLYAIGEDGRKRGSLRVLGTKNADWEDLAACEFDGKRWLVVGDVGDNDGQRPYVRVHIVEEPKPEHLIPQGDLSATPAFTLQIAYPDGARDCESIAVDPGERTLYLLTKRDPVPRLYRVPLVPVSGDRLVLAELVGTVPHILQPSGAERKLKGHLGRRRAEVCAMDFAADGSGAVVLTYGSVLYFPRRAGESWADALQRQPVVLGAHDLPQAEAACFSPDSRRIYVASESSPKLIRYDRR